MLLKNYIEGSDLTLLNTYYLYPQKNEETGKWSKDSITLIYKDNVTGQKHHETIHEPDYEFYMAKPEEMIDHNMLFIEKEKVQKISSPYSKLEKTIAEVTDNLPFYYDNIKNGNRRANQRLHDDTRIFGSDSNIEEHYRFRFDNEYTNSIIPISKAYFDIEADTINMKGDFPEPGECPVNAVTLINEATNKVYVFLLRNPNNPLIEEFEKSINNDLFVELKDFIRDSVGGYKKEIKYGLDKLQYEFLFYDEEIGLLQELFLAINTLQPDFIMAWNMAFDMPYMIQRIKNLGYSAESIICHPDFEVKVCKYKIDENADILSERGDDATISSYTKYIDQLIQFASRRKGQGVFSNFKLDSIGNLTVGVKKLDYSHITTSIAKLPYLNYKVFVFYNIIDVIVQKCIESKVGDIDYTFNKCLINNTRYNKAHRQTVYLVNRGKKEFYTDGFIMGNNTNRKNAKPTEKFPGAFVADPMKLDDYAKLKRYGLPVNIFNNSDDFDYKSLYPSIMREFNIAPHTQIGRIDILDKMYNNEDPFNNKYYNRGGAFIEDLHSGVFLQFGHRWLGLAQYSDLYKDILEYFTKRAFSANPVFMFNDKGQVPMVRFRQEGQMMKMVSFDEGKQRMVYKYYQKPDYQNIYDNINRNGVAIGVGTIE